MRSQRIAARAEPLGTSGLRGLSGRRRWPWQRSPAPCIAWLLGNRLKAKANLKCKAMAPNFGWIAFYIPLLKLFRTRLSYRQMVAGLCSKCREKRDNIHRAGRRKWPWGSSRQSAKRDVKIQFPLCHHGKICQPRKDQNLFSRYSALFIS